MPFIFEQSQHGSDSRIARRLRKALHHLRRRGLAALIDDVHNLTLAAAQVYVGLLAHLWVLAIRYCLTGSATPVRRQRAKNLAPSRDSGQAQNAIFLAPVMAPSPLPSFH